MAGKMQQMIKTGAMMLAGAAALGAMAAPADAQVVKLKKNPQSLILDGARVPAGYETFYLSGQLANPVDPAKTMAQVTSIEDLGDTKTQTISILNKIEALLTSQGYKLSDVVKMTLFIAPDPKLGKLDFAGANEGFKQFFNTTKNPDTVARSAFQVAALAGPYFLIEIESIAVKKPVVAKKH
jgi:2-iminobutanoate/2-iminopropanoate deaminase